MDDGACQRPSDPRDRLDLGDDELAQLIDGASFRADYHVIRAGYVLGERHTRDLADCVHDGGGLSNLGLNQYVGLNEHTRTLLSSEELRHE